MKIRKSLAGIAAGSLALTGLAVIAAPAAQAATKNTNTAPVINASPVNAAGLASFGGTGTVITLSAAQVGQNVEVTVSGPNGPYTSAFAAYLGGDYQLQTYVRMDGVANTRGTMAAGPTGLDPVAVSSPTYPGGFSITTTFPNVTAGSHTFTLTDLLLNGNGASSGGNFGTPTGFDAFYNPGTTTTEVLAGVDWNLSETITVVGPSANITGSSNQMAGVTGYVRGGTGVTATVTGNLWSNSVAVGGFTAAFCDQTGTSCDANATNTLSSNGSGVLSGTVSIAAATTTGLRALKVTEGTKTALYPVTVLAAPSITISPASGGPGTTVSWSGSSFNPGGFGIAHGSVPNPNGVCAVAGTCTGAPAGWTPAGNYPVGPYVNGLNTIVGWTATATGTGSGTVVVSDPTSIFVQVSQKSITGGAPANTNLDMTSLGQGTSKTAAFTLSALSCNSTGLPVGNPLACNTEQNVTGTVAAGPLSQSIEATAIALKCFETATQDCDGDNTFSEAGAFASIPSSATGGLINAPINEVTVSDLRGGETGWSLTAKMKADLSGTATSTAAGATISAAQLSISGLTCVADSNSVDPTLAPTSTGPLDVTQQLCQNSEVNPATDSTSGLWAINGELELDVPAFAKAGDYAGVLVVTLV